MLNAIFNRFFVLQWFKAQEKATRRPVLGLAAGEPDLKQLDMNIGSTMAYQFKVEHCFNDRL